ncbi:matrixin family metalloprotease [Candidatus Daviesbacteria bacterium]|nr:matrixin family metalloprotease [Candidatus Daviesbacteria bacterium]
MKNIIAGILFLVTILIFIIVLKPVSFDNLFTFSYCDKPIRYRLDTVDPRFNLSREDFLSDISHAAQIWSSAYGRNLFVYDPKGDLSINLVYDERQSLTTQISQLENKVQSEKQSLNPKISEYQRLSLEFKQKVDNLNKEVEDWNSKGGAPPEVYQQLIKRQQDLQKEAENLNALAGSLNNSTSNFNTQVDELNQTIDTLNSALEQRPEEGIYKGPENRIEIYFNTNKQELVHTIAHELGHALGIGHVGDPKAIMYLKTSKKVNPTQDDIQALKDVCRRYNYIELFQIQLLQTLKYMYRT